jgi:hypothetical protein
MQEGAGSQPPSQGQSVAPTMVAPPGVGQVPASPPGQSPIPEAGQFQGGQQGYAPPQGGTAQPPVMGYQGHQGYQGQQGYQPPVQTGTSGMAIAGFVLSFFCGLLGLIFSIIGYNECKASDGRIGGEGLALAGIIISIVTLLLGILMAIGGGA